MTDKNQLSQWSNFQMHVYDIDIVSVTLIVLSPQMHVYDIDIVSVRLIVLSPLADLHVYGFN